ncbi:MAG: nicotinate phosphoribosyltransferase [Oscillospiraceae bacterium]|nr:nicotinate phosphoribosyltransferase [Oscillospiraceae bacterium]
MNPMLNIDFYKSTHSKMYPAEMSRIVSYLTPRGTRIEGEDKLVMFGLQAFIKEFLIKAFGENFFSVSEEKCVDEYTRILDSTIGRNAYDSEKIRALHRLGYLPIRISAVAEGTRVPVKVPMIQLENTHPDFAWVVEYIESVLSAEMWHGMVSANMGYMYRRIVNKYYGISVDDDVPRAKALGDFSFRGQESLSSAVKSSAAFCLSFLNTATVPAIPWLEEYYNCDCTKEPVAYGAVSTEHSVMCSNYAFDGDEITMYRRLLTELYPDTSFSVVSDTYDYWNLVDNILPQLKNEILAHNGTMLIRGDSGDPVDIVTRTVFRLWDIFGGSVNSKGYKVLDSHVKAIYGDSITPQRCERIFKILIENGFACSNAALGVGSFSMQCLEIGDRLYPHTRDTFQIAVKATYCESRGGEKYQIFKAPKTDTGKVKVSHRGMCAVYRDENGEITVRDGFDSDSIKEFEGENLLVPVFENGRMLKEYTLGEIRNILHDNNF